MPTFRPVAKLVTAALVLLAATTAFGRSKPPVAPVRDVRQTYFGTAASDPYR